MKKNIAILLVAVLVIPMCFIPANAENEGDISFRGIPFGTSYTETIEALKEQGIEVGSKPRYNEIGANYLLDCKKVIVAGYEMDLTVCFINLDNRKDVDVKIEDCVFYDATYRYNWAQSIFETKIHGDSNLYKPYEEFKIKLGSLYGTPVSSSNNETTWETKNASIELKVGISRLEITNNLDVSTTSISYKWKESEEAFEKNK